MKVFFIRDVIRSKFDTDTKMNVYDKINTSCEPQVNLLGLIVIKRQTKDPAQQVIVSSYDSIVASSHAGLYAYSVSLFAARDKSKMNGNGNGKR